MSFRSGKVQLVKIVFEWCTLDLSRSGDIFHFLKKNYVLVVRSYKYFIWMEVAAPF